MEPTICVLLGDCLQSDETFGYKTQSQSSLANAIVKRWDIGSWLKQRCKLSEVKKRCRQGWSPRVAAVAREDSRNVNWSTQRGVNESFRDFSSASIPSHIVRRFLPLARLIIIFYHAAFYSTEKLFPWDMETWNLSSEHKISFNKNIQHRFFLLFGREKCEFSVIYLPSRFSNLASFE